MTRPSAPRTIVAVALSLVGPGTGHLLLARPLRGAAWLAAGLLAAGSAFLSPVLMALVLVGTRLACAGDVLVLRRTSQASPSAGQVMPLLAMFVGALVAGRFLVSSYVVEAFSTPSASMLPTLEIGDHVLIDKLAYRFGAPRRGDVAVFAHPCEPAKDYIKRIVALPGDTVELRCGQLYIGGAAVATQRVDGPCTYWDRDELDEWYEVPCSKYAEQLGERRFATLRAPDRPVTGDASDGASFDPLGNFPGDELPACMGSTEEPAALGRIEESLPSANLDPCTPSRHFVVPDQHVFVLGDHRHNSSDSRSFGPVPIASLKGRLLSIWWSSGPSGVRWQRIGSLDR